MTYPPQQPGPYGQQGPWGPPAQGPYPPQPPPQTPPWLTNDPGGFPAFEPEERKSRAGLVATLVIVGLLVLGGGGFGLWLALSGNDSGGGGDTGGGGEGGSDARAVAERYVAELEKTVNTDLEDIDLSALEPLTCADDFERMDREIGDAQASGAAADPGTIEVGMADFQSSEDRGSFTLTQVVDGEEGPDTEMTMAKEDGDWKVCGLYGTAPPPSAPESPSAEVEPSAPNSGPVPNPIPSS